MARLKRILATVFTSSACSVGTPGAGQTTGGASRGTTGIVSTGATAVTTTVATDTTGAVGTASTSSASSSGSSSNGSDTDTTGDAPPVCPAGAGQVYGSRGFANPGFEQATSLVIGPMAQMTALFHSVGCNTGEDLQFGGATFPLAASAGTDLVLAQYDLSLGNLKTHVFGGVGRTTGEALAVDAEGNVYLAGYFDDHVDIPVELGGDNVVQTYLAVPPASFASFVAVFDPAGKTIWRKDVRSQGGDVKLYGVSVGPGGEFAVVGEYSGVLEPNLGGCPMVSGPSSALVVQVYDSKFVHQWTRCATELVKQPTNRSRLFGVAVGPDGGVVASGDFTGSLALGDVEDVSTHVASVGGFDAIVIGWDAVGGHTWHKACGSESADQVYDVALGEDGRVIMGGRIGDLQACSDGEFHPGSTKTSAFVAAFDPSARPGGWIFDRKLTTSGEVVDSSHLYNVLVEPCGDIVVAGFAAGPAAWADSPDLPFADAVPGGEEDIIVARLKADGSKVWERRFQSELNDTALAVATDSQGSVYAGGWYGAELTDVGPAPWPGELLGDCSSRNAFLLHLSP